MAKNQEKPRIITRKHLVGLERERFYNRILGLGTLAVLVIVIGLITWPWLSKNAIRPVFETLIYNNQTVATVEGQQIEGRDFIARTKLYRAQLVSNYLAVLGEYQYMSSLFGSDATAQSQIDSQYQNQLLTYQYQLTPEIVGQLAINELIDDEMLKREAADMGIAISDEEVESRVQDLFQYFPNGTPTAPPEITTAPTSTLSAAQLAIISATPPATDTPTPSGSDIATEEPSSTPTSEATTDQTATLSSTPSATATAYTLEGFQAALVDYAEAIGVTQDDFRAVIYSSLLRSAITNAITLDLPRTQEQVWARHILVATIEEAEAALDRLDNGEDWSALAAELSLDTSNKDAGGDLGWFPREQMVEPFANAAFDMSVGEISDPVESEFGFHIIQVIGHEDRPLSSDEYDQLRQQKLLDFIETLRSKYAWTVDDPAWQAMAPDQPDIPVDSQLQTQQ